MLALGALPQLYHMWYLPLLAILGIMMGMRRIGTRMKDWNELMRSIQVTLDFESFEKLERLSYELRKNKSELIREMIKRYFEEWSKGAKEVIDPYPEGVI